MILDIVIVMLVVAAVAIIVNGVSDYHKHGKVNMSFKEAMDLVDLPIVTFYNNGKKFNFLLDSGATLSVIDSNILSSVEHKKLDNTGDLYGMEGKKIKVTFVRIPLEYKDTKYEEDFQVVDMGAAFKEIKSESGVSLSGILGNQFFKKYQYILDFESLVAYSKK